MIIEEDTEKIIPVPPLKVILKVVEFGLPESRQYDFRQPNFRRHTPWTFAIGEGLIGEIRKPLEFVCWLKYCTHVFACSFTGYVCV